MKGDGAMPKRIDKPGMFLQDWEKTYEIDGVIYDVVDPSYYDNLNIKPRYPKSIRDRESGIVYEISPKTGKVKKRPRPNSGKNKVPQLYDLDPKDAKDIGRFNLALARQNLIPWDDIEGYVERFNWFFEFTQNAGFKPTVEGFCLAMGWCEIKVLMDCGRGLHGEFFINFAKKAKFTIQNFITLSTMESKINPVTYIFYSKNYFGMSDKVEIEATAKTELIDSEAQNAILNALPG